MRSNKNIEMKIYELLGVNIFRKYILFTWEKIAKLFKLDIGYRLNEYSIKGLQEYKIFAKSFAYTHLILLIVLDLLFINDLSQIIFNTILNSYCIMTQRYTCIRINHLIEKMELRQKNEKNVNNNELKKDDSLVLEYTDSITINENQKNIDLSNISDLEQLKQYRERLVSIQDTNQTAKKTESMVNDSESNGFEEVAKQKSR